MKLSLKLTDNEKLQQFKIQHQMLTQQIQEFEKQNEMFQKQMIDLTMTVQSLDEFKEMKKGDEILVPINHGMYAKAEVKETGSLLVNVGSDVVVNKSVDDTKKLMQEQVVELAKIQERMNENMNKIIDQTRDVEKEIHKLMARS
jgi:prefoldin alpha subunit